VAATSSDLHHIRLILSLTDRKHFGPLLPYRHRLSPITTSLCAMQAMLQPGDLLCAGACWHGETAGPSKHPDNATPNHLLPGSSLQLLAKLVFSHSAQAKHNLASPVLSMQLHAAAILTSPVSPHTITALDTPMPASHCPRH
jgi:hypothetical protein